MSHIQIDCSSLVPTAAVLTMAGVCKWFVCDYVISNTERNALIYKIVQSYCHWDLRTKSQIFPPLKLMEMNEIISWKNTSLQLHKGKSTISQHFLKQQLLKSKAEGGWEEEWMGKNHVIGSAHGPVSCKKSESKLAKQILQETVMSLTPRRIPPSSLQSSGEK